jgi:VIT1/CCC1 family predicted Fe2+/Mn2+ transporter
MDLGVGMAREHHMSGALQTGMYFGLTSGVITTLGLMVGLHSGTHSLLAVVGGILTIAIADACADALGIHIAEEAENVHTPRDIWLATGATFLTKFCMALTFLVPVFLWELPTAIILGVVWGLGVLTVLSFQLARAQGIRPWKVIGEHLVIAGAVITLTHLIGDWVATAFT